MDEFKYMIFRIYTQEERADRDQRAVFYGWTRSKVIRDAFMAQRKKRKYRCIKMYDEDIARYYSEDATDDSTMINILKLKSAADGKEYSLFMTANEVKQAEIEIQRMMEDACRLENIDADLNLLVDFFTSLDDYYADALMLIGYRPPEIRYKFPGADDEDDLTSTERQIEEVYNHNCSRDGDVKALATTPPEIRLEQVADMVVYSLESFVRVMRNDL